MLGTYSTGMVVQIPATFRDGNQRPVEMENVIVGIQKFDQAHRRFEYILKDTNMLMSDKGMYLYEFTIPHHAEPGDYIVSIRAKHAGSISNVYEASDTFKVTDAAPQPQKPKVDMNITASIDAPKMEPEVEQPSDFDIKTFKIDQVKNRLSHTKIDVEDVIVDVYNLPIKGVHVNVFEKHGFMPKSPNNVKVGSTISDENGIWKMSLPAGEYVFTYKGIGVKEMREFRKVA
jgi:hypothetical protein